MTKIFLIILFHFITFSLSSQKLDKEGKNIKIEKKVNNEEIYQKWLLRQDSFRSHILSKKSHETLKSCLFQDLYIWDYIKEQKDYFLFELAFDLHALDCRAPDCYRTNIRFKIPIGDSLIFPKTLAFKFSVTGCLKKKSIRSVFELIENSEDYVQYYSPELKSTLVFFNEDGEAEHVYFIKEVERSFIFSRDSKKFFANFLEGDKMVEAYPLRISILATKEYNRHPLVME